MIYVCIFSLLVKQILSPINTMATAFDSGCPQMGLRRSNIPEAETGKEVELTDDER